MTRPGFRCHPRSKARSGVGGTAVLAAVVLFLSGCTGESKPAKTPWMALEWPLSTLPRSSQLSVSEIQALNALPNRPTVSVLAVVRAGDHRVALGVRGDSCEVSVFTVNPPSEPGPRATSLSVQRPKIGDAQTTTTYFLDPPQLEPYTVTAGPLSGSPSHIRMGCGNRSMTVEFESDVDVVGIDGPLRISRSPSGVSVQLSVESPSGS
jgi:hypothetical protein